MDTTSSSPEVGQLDPSLSSRNFAAPTTPKKKQFLFVDDDYQFLRDLEDIFTEMSRGTWKIFTAENHAQALSIIQKQRIDVVVLDVDMPVMDGLQFLKLLGSTHPELQVVMLTGKVDEEKRKACLENGAKLFLEKLLTPEAFAGTFATLDSLATGGPAEGFRGVMRQVGLQEVLQMECLGKKSSILEIFTGKSKGRIYISDGTIIHAESGQLQGEVALYGILGLRGGEFNLLPYTEPAERTISAQYEFLLMEAARLKDESNDPDAPQPETSSPEPDPAIAFDTEHLLALENGGQIRIEEVMLASGASEPLYEWHCKSAADRTKLIQQIEQQAVQLGRLVRAGLFERLEIITNEGRTVCAVTPQMRLLVRSASNLAS